MAARRWPSPFDAVEGVSPGSADEFFVRSRLGPRRVILDGSRSARTSSRPSSLKSLQPVGGFDSWFGEYAEIAVPQAEGGRVSASAVGPSLGSATDDDVLELEGVDSNLVLMRRRAPWGRSQALSVASRGSTRRPIFRQTGSRATSDSWRSSTARTPWRSRGLPSCVIGLVAGHCWESA